MPFIEPDKLNRTELFPGAESGLVSGEHIMLSFLEIPQDRTRLEKSAFIRVIRGKIFGCGSAALCPPWLKPVPP